MKHIEKETELKELINNDLVLVDYYAQWCGPCQLLAPILENLEKEEKNLIIVKVNVDSAPDLAKNHGIMSIPTIEIYKKEELIAKKVGLLSKEEIKDLIK